MPWSPMASKSYQHEEAKPVDMILVDCLHVATIFMGCLDGQKFLGWKFQT
jgi:hypothetical protein